MCFERFLTLVDQSKLICVLINISTVLFNCFLTLNLIEFVAEAGGNIFFLLISALIPGVFTFANFYFTERVKTQANKEIEKIKFEIQRQYMLTEIRVKHVLKIYPDIYRLLREACGFMCVFDAANTRINNLDFQKICETKKVEKLNEYLCKIDREAVLKKINDFAEIHESNSLFMSTEVDRLALNIRESIMEAYQLAKVEIFSDKFQKYTYSDYEKLIKNMNEIDTKLRAQKKFISRQMNKELDPIIDESR